MIIGQNNMKKSSFIYVKNVFIRKDRFYSEMVVVVGIRFGSNSRYHNYVIVQIFSRLLDDALRDNLNFWNFGKLIN